MRASDFDFDLPQDRIAHEPARPREAARLLHVRGTLTDCHISDLVDLLRPGDLLVSNDTRVIPAQLTARRGDATIGITLDRPSGDGGWHALVRNARRMRVGDTLQINADFAATVRVRGDDGSAVLDFNCAGADFDIALRRAGALALPPYIDRPEGPTAQDAADYQTMFAAKDGAVAAPTAGLHFTPPLLTALSARGIGHVTVTLHVGAGTFLPMRTEAVSDHRMHPERGVISPAAADAINAATGRIVAVGTTSLRLLESAVDADGRIQPFDGETAIFITPGHKITSADLLLTNFHLPKSTLFMLVCAFAGQDRMRAAYTHAIASDYRFYSYGDACLLERA